MIVVLLVVLSTAAAEPRAILALPLLLPLSLLAAAEVDTLRRGLSGVLDWFGILTFGLVGDPGVGASGWSRCGMACRSRSRGMFHDTQPGLPAVRCTGCRWRSPIFLSLLWVVLVRPARRSNRRAVLNWAAGMTLVWGLYMTIWLPYLDSRRSYRPVAESLAAHLPRERMRGQSQPGRSAARAVRLLHRPDHRARRDRAWTQVQDAARCRSAARTPTSRPIRHGKRYGKAVAAATTPSAIFLFRRSDARQPS